MRQPLISSMAPALWAMTFFDAFSIIAMFKDHQKHRTDRIALLTGILCFGLFYDSLILACGAFLPFGPLLKTLSQFRYILHCVLIPLLFPICAYAFNAKPKLLKAVWIISILIMVVGLYAGISVVTEERTVGAIRRYAESDLTPKFADSVIQMLDIVPVFFMIGVGIVLWVRRKNPNMFYAGFFMLAFTLIGIFFGKDPGGDKSQSLMFYISMYGEALMVYFLYRFIKAEENR